MSRFGPKPKIEDPEQLKQLMRLKPTLKDTAAFFDVHPDTVANTIRREWNLTFSEFQDQNFVHTRMMLVRTAIEKAEKGDNVMLIFCLKNVCGWRDKWEEPSDEKKLRDKLASMSTKELIAAAKEQHPELLVAAG